MIRSSVAVAGILAGLLAAAPAAGAREPVDGGAAPRTLPSHVMDRVIVRWERDASAAERRRARAEADTSLVRGIGEPGVQLLTVDGGQAVADALTTLEGDPAVRRVERDWPNAPHAGAGEPLFDELWGLRNLGGPFGVLGVPGPLAGADIDVLGAWARTVGTPSTVVAVIDSGYRVDHPDLGSVVWSNPGEVPGNGLDDDGNTYVDDVNGYDFVGDDADEPVADGDPTDSDLITGGHGVHTAGTIGADGDNDLGITGVGQDLRLMPLRVCAHSPEASAVEPPRPRSSCPESSLIEAIDYAGDNGAAVVNVSLGRAGIPSQEAIDALGSHPETLYVMSAGNDGSDNDDGAPAPNGSHYPCDYDPAAQSIEPGAIDNVICVAASDQADELAGFSNWGATSVDLAAPGTETLSSYPAIEARYSEDFEAEDFDDEWSATAASGFGRADDGPLTSFGMSDSPGGAPAASTVHQTTSTTGFALPAGYGSCELSGERFLALGAGSFRYSVLSDGVPVANFEPGSSSAPGLSGFFTSPIDGLAGTTVTLRFRYVSDATPTAAEGAWLDDLRVECFEPVDSTAATYAYLQGTSMAAPHVAGAAALLRSLDPAASVGEVRDALLANVDRLDGLDGLVATGGRLDVARALNALAPPAPPGPAGTGSTTTTTPSPPAGGSRSPVVVLPRCKVPKLRKLSLAKARKALVKAHCRLGKVAKPGKRGRRRLPPLVVRSSRPRAGAERAADAKVAVTLGPKPRPKQRRKR